MRYGCARELRCIVRQKKRAQMETLVFRSPDCPTEWRYMDEGLTFEHIRRKKDRHLFSGTKLACELGLCFDGHKVKHLCALATAGVPLKATEAR